MGKKKDNNEITKEYMDKVAGMFKEQEEINDDYLQILKLHGDRIDELINKIDECHNTIKDINEKISIIEKDIAKLKNSQKNLKRTIRTSK